MNNEVLSKDEIIKIAKLARLIVSNEDASGLTKEINSILGYVKQLDQIDVSNIEPMSHVHGSTNIFRPDIPKTYFGIERLLEIVPEASGRFIKVPIIVDQE